jgi:poly(hydroxyalkanoate) granule-associated protein
MVKKIKGNADSQWSQSVRESAHLVWLAGLGAFAKIGEEGGKLFETLVKEGEKVEEQTREAADDKLAAVRQKTEVTRGKVVDAWDKVEQLFEDRLARVLGRLGVPSRDDLQELTRRVDALQEHVNDLRKVGKSQQS